MTHNSGNLSSEELQLWAIELFACWPLVNLSAVSSVSPTFVPVHFAQIKGSG